MTTNTKDYLKLSIEDLELLKAAIIAALTEKKRTKLVGEKLILHNIGIKIAKADNIVIVNYKKQQIAGKVTKTKARTFDMIVNIDGTEKTIFRYYSDVVKLVEEKPKG